MEQIVSYYFSITDLNTLENFTIIKFTSLLYIIYEPYEK